MHSALLYFTLLCSPASSSPPPPPPLPRRLRAAECEERGARRKESSRQREIEERERDGERRGGGVEEAPKNIPPDVSCCSHIRPLHLHCSIPTHTSALHAAGRLVTTEQHQHRGAPLSESCMLEKKSFRFTLIFKPDHHKLQPNAGFCTERKHFVCLDPKVTRSGHVRG